MRVDPYGGCGLSKPMEGHRQVLHPKRSAGVPCSFLQAPVATLKDVMKMIIMDVVI